MGRYAKPSQIVEDLKNMIEANGGLKAIVDSDRFKVRKDLLKVDVGHEVVGFVSWESPAFEIMGSGDASFPVVWCCTHGLGEMPVAFVMYIGQEGGLRAYIPLQGNNVRGHEAISRDVAGSSKLDYGKMRDSVVNRISVKGAATSDAKVELTFRQIIQSLRDYGDQYASVRPYAKGAENPFWGIEDIWFDDGVLNLGQTDDEGLTCDLIAERIEKCVPGGLLDNTAVVRVGVTDKRNGKMDLVDVDGEASVNHTVKSSEVKSIRGDDCFCKWILKYAS